MIDMQKKYIENNIDLIDGNDWDKFFKAAPQGIGIGGVLYEAGIDFMTQLGYIPKAAFSWCELESIVIPDSVTSIGDYAFYYCKSLTSISIPDSITSIGKNAFSYCTNLESVTIGNSVTSMGDEAFYNCGKLEINYDGTTDNWKTLIGNNSKVFQYTTYTCNCSDGVVKRALGDGGKL